MDIIFKLSTVIFVMILQLILYTHVIYSDRQRRISHDKIYTELNETLMISLLELTRLKLRLLEFPKEEEIENKIPEILNKLEKYDFESNLN